MPKGLDSQIFSPANLNLEIGKKGSHHFQFHWNLQTEIWEADMVRKFYLLLAFVRGPSISSSVAVLGDFFSFFQPVKIILTAPTVGEGEISPYSCSFG